MSLKKQPGDTSKPATDWDDDPPTELPPLPDSDDADRTIYDPDPGTMEQIRHLTAGWNQPTPTLPTAVVPPPSGDVSKQANNGLPGEESRMNLSDFSPLRADGTIDFDAVYARNGLSPAGFGAEPVLQMISELPPEMSAEMKKQTVQVMIRTMGRHVGASPEAIAHDASGKVNALTTFVSEYERSLRETTAGVETEIASLQALIEEKKRTLKGTTERLDQVRSQCDKEAVRLGQIMDYVSLAPAPFPTHGAAYEHDEDTADTVER